MLSADQIAQYHRDGFIAVEGVYSPEDIAEMRRVTEDYVEQSRAVTAHTEVLDLEPGHTAEAPRLRRIKQPADHHAVYRKALHHAPMLDMVAQLIGPAMRVNSTKLNLKTGEFGSAVEWHQDLAFYPHTNEDVLAVGVALDDMTVENGALMMVPGSHKGPVFDHHDNGYFVGAISDMACLEGGTVPIQMKAGSISIHHGRIVHGSAPNHSNKPRRLLLFELRANDAWPLLGIPNWEDFNARILRGDPVQAPRVEPVPVRIPLPPPPTVGSIYEVQTHMRAKILARQ